MTRNELDRLIACPTCDLLHEVVDVAPGHKARCRRCHTLLIAPRRQSMDVAIALALTTAMLMIGAVSFPFLTMSQSGLEQSTSILGLVTIFSGGWMIVAGAFVALNVIALPLVRAGALIYTLLPLRLGRKPAPGAKQVFLFAQWLLPWAMTEIFIVGTMVALVKLMGLASVGFGPAFWLYCILVVVVAFKDASVCKWTIWKLLNQPAAA
ncbi:paraquat-inducible protein A [Pseudoruegeria sp. SHC-113]|uniref:paraquat-inducible protein A n=1 Tax=Pseudoruegeria sp. SHC-113 TaxID=2855439 RepID=UPI0021BB90FA|nr:paraquat-inducible protein A [Pseudoruegeria sp. SHC-113]MCT8161406.1 paraquat-inducible protein A [Pseudoruegeria sp. SHC-113]